MRLLIGLGVGLLAWSWPGVAGAATLFFSPGSGSAGIGQTITVSVKVSAGGQAINAAEGVVTFPPSLLEFQSASRNGSVFSLWPSEPSGSNTTGQVNFSGGLPNPGYSGSGGTVLTLVFKARAAGTAQLRLTGGKVLANDGQGTNVLTSQGAANFTLTQAVPTPTPAAPGASVPTLSSSTHPDQDAWYQDLLATFSHSQPPGLIGVSYGLTAQSNSVPDESQDPANGSINLTVPSEGIWYFHLRGRFASGWGSSAHYRLQIDRTAPTPLTITLVRDRGEDDPTPTFEFSTTDALSGIAEYRLALNDGEAEVVESPVTLTLTRAGKQRITVTAIDQAGNEQSSSLDVDFIGYPPPVITYVIRRLILLDDLIVRGTAAAGDLVTILLDGQPIGSLTAGPADQDQDSGVIVRMPWSFTTNQVFRPGEYALTATATSPDGLVSLSTDPIKLTVAGSTITIGGRPLLTLAVAPSLVAVLVLIILGNVVILVRLFMLLRGLYRRDVLVDQELHDLQRRIRRQRLTTEQVEDSLEQIERDLEGRVPSPRRTRKRS